MVLSPTTCRAPAPRTSWQLRELKCCGEQQKLDVQVKNKARVQKCDRAASDLQEVRQTRQHVGGDGRDVVDTLTVFQKDPDQQQNRPAETETRPSQRFTFKWIIFNCAAPVSGHVPDDGVFLPVDQQKLGGLPLLRTCIKKTSGFRNLTSVRGGLITRFLPDDAATP